MYAFPSGHNPKTGTQEAGMSLRDYFAAAALQGMLADRSGAVNKEELAAFVYILADEMMKARDL